MIAENRLELQIMDLFLRNNYLRLSINQIASKLGKKYPYINRKVNEMIQEGIFRKVIVGRSHLCTPDLKNPKTVVLLTLLELKKKKALERSSQESAKSFFDTLRQSLQPHFIIFSKDRYLVVTDDKFKMRRLLSRAPRGVRMQGVSSEEMASLLADQDIMGDHVIVYGFERYFEFIADRQQELRERHDPLMN